MRAQLCELCRMLAQQISMRPADRATATIPFSHAQVYQFSKPSHDGDGFSALKSARQLEEKMGSTVEKFVPSKSDKRMSLGCCCCEEEEEEMTEMGQGGRGNGSLPI